MAGRDKAALDRLGNPDMGAVIGGSFFGESEKEMLTGTTGTETRFQKTEGEAGTDVTLGGATGSASKFQSDEVGTMEVRWRHKRWPAKIRGHDVEAAINSDVALGAIQDETEAMVLNRALNQVNLELLQGTLTAAQQNQTLWPNTLGLEHWVNDGVETAATATVGRVDRTVETVLKAEVLTAANLQTDGHLSSSIPKLSLLRTINTISGTGTSGEVYPALRNKGPGCDLVLTTADLFGVLADEALDRHVYPVTSVPEFAYNGFNKEMIRWGETWITYEENIASGEMFFLTTGWWAFVVQTGHNFKLEDWVAKWKNEENGEYYLWSALDASYRLVCKRPWLNALVTGLTTS